MYIIAIGFSLIVSIKLHHYTQNFGKISKISKASKISKMSYTHNCKLCDDNGNLVECNFHFIQNPYNKNDCVIEVYDAKGNRFINSNLIHLPLKYFKESCKTGKFDAYYAWYFEDELLYIRLLDTNYSFKLTKHSDSLNELEDEANKLEEKARELRLIIDLLKK